MVHFLSSRLFGLFLALLLVTGLGAPDVSFAQSCPGSAHTGGSIPAGTRVKIVALSSSDAFYASRGTIVGKEGRVDKMDSTGSPCWFGGQFHGDDGSSYYFYQAAFEVAGAPTAGGCPSGAYTGSSLSSGTRVEVITVSPEDAYYSTRGKVEGKVGRVDGTWSKTGGSCWFAGQFYGDGGESFYFYQAAVRTLSGSAPATAAGGSCPAGSYTGAPPSSGTRVRVLTVSKDDAYFSGKDRVEGKVGRTDGAWSSTGSPCWYAGQFYADDGSSFYFYQAALEVLTTGGGGVVGGSGGATCPPGAATSGFAEGARVRVVGVHPDDAYYPNAAKLIGLSGAVTGDLHSNEGCWMGGGFTADDGTYYYFYKAAVVGVSGGGGGSALPITGARHMGDSVPNGQKFRIVALHSDDAYYSDRAQIVGKQCAATDMMNRQDKGWFSGPAKCTDGSDFYFFKVGVILE